MDTEGQDFLSISSGKDAPPTGPPLETSAKTLADGTISRKQALKLMGAGTAAVASLALAGCGGNTDQAKGSSSGSGQPSGTSMSDTTVGQKGSTSKQGPDAGGGGGQARDGEVPPEGGPGAGHQGHRGVGDGGDG